MNRSEFLKEMGKSLGMTIKGAISHVVEEKKEGIEKAAMILTNQDWYELTLNQPTKEQTVVDTFAGKQPVLLTSTENGWRAFHKVCPVCKTMIHYNQYEKRCHCFICDTQKNMTDGSGQLHLKELDVIEKEHKWFVGLPYEK